jgi:hypothetical protein
MARYAAPHLQVTARPTSDILANAWADGWPSTYSGSLGRKCSAVEVFRMGRWSLHGPQDWDPCQGAMTVTALPQLGRVLLWGDRLASLVLHHLCEVRHRLGEVGGLAKRSDLPDSFGALQGGQHVLVGAAQRSS